jgi:curved DNA-binding protein CbpA
MAEGDLYAVLGVDRGAEPEVIDAAYRALARKYHPDVNRASDAVERTRRLNDAYRTLHDAAARAQYDATLALREARAPGSVQSTPRPFDGDRPVDLFGAAMADVWRRTRAARERSAGSGRATVRDAGVPEADPGDAPAARSLARRLALPAVTLGAGVFLGAVGMNAAAGRSGRALRTYWGTAALGRASVAEARQAHEALSAAGFPAAVGNASFGSASTQLVAALEGAAARLRGAGAIPPEAESYHFLQLDDWREERDLRTAQRDAIQSRNADAWIVAADREATWRTSALHTKTEVAAAQLAALAART